MSVPHISSIHPLRAVEGGRVTIEGDNFVQDEASASMPIVTMGGVPTRVVFASRRAISALVPSGLKGGRTPVRIDGGSGETAFIDVGRVVATGLHQVDSPAIDGQGTLFVTYSGTRGERSPVSVFRIRSDGYREPFVTGITNATSLVFAPDGHLHVSSRFDGTVYRVADDGSFEPVATELGVACGMAFSADGTLYVGDRSGTVFRVSTSGHATPFVTLPESVAAFHLAWGHDDSLYVSAPTLSPYDRVYRIDRTGQIGPVTSSFGRPQGLAFDIHGVLHVVEALAGVSGVYRLDRNGNRSCVLAGPRLVGITFDSSGGFVVASSETAYQFEATPGPLA